MTQFGSAGHTQKIQKLAFSPDGRWLATGSYDTSVRLWEVATGRFHELRGDAGSIWSLAFSPDGRTLAAGNLNGAVKLWNVATRREMSTLEAHTTVVNGIGFSPDGRMLVTSGGEITRVWPAPGFEETDTKN